MLVNLASDGDSEANTSTPLKRQQKEFAENLSGFAHFTATSLFQVLKGTTILIVYFALLMTIIEMVAYACSFQQSIEPVEIIRFVVGVHSVVFCVIPCTFIAVKFSSLRVFRGLPLSARHLSSRLFQILFGVVLIQAVLLSLLMFLAGNYNVPTLLILLGFTGIGCLFIPLVFRFGFDKILLAFAFLFVPLLSIGASLFFTLAVLGIGLVCVLISWLLTWRVLARSSQAYRRNSGRFS